MSLIDGDLSLGGTGTVTHVEDGRVYAFGHPFYNLGPTEFPMTRAYVHALLPSLMSSSKLSTMGEIIGTFQQDRAVTIAGELGAGPSLIPITVALETDARTEAHVQVPGRARPALHAGPGLCLGAQHAEVVRARVRRGDVHA